jgi:predicted cobalt transporter CbtA
MKLDIRIPIGMLFTLIGALLVLQGVVSGAPLQGAAAGLNINVWWGAVVVVFGVGMLLLACRHVAALRKGSG